LRAKLQRLTLHYGGDFFRQCRRDELIDRDLLLTRQYARLLVKRIGKPECEFAHRSIVRSEPGESSRECALA